MPPANAERPIFWIVAGPNGSGKSSIYQDVDIELFARSIWIINPDLLTARIQAVEQLQLRDANLQAVQRIEAWLRASIRAHQTVGVETVLSTDKYRRLVREAKVLGFEVRLTYVILESADHSIERVKLRVAKGGHDVPRDRIIARYARSLEQLPWFLEQADQASIFDNSSASPRLIASKHAGTIVVDPEALPQIIEVMQKVASG